jgi:hypothetical protein
MRLVVKLLPRLLYHAGEKAGPAPEVVWTFQRREKSLACARIQTSDCPVHSVVTIPPTLS